MEAFHDGRLVRVEVTDRVQSALVNVYDPTAFQYSRELRSGHAADRVSVWTDEPPYNWETDEHKYEVGTVERNLLSVFGGPSTVDSAQRTDTADHHAVRARTKVHRRPCGAAGHADNSRYPGGGSSAGTDRLQCGRF